MSKRIPVGVSLNPVIVSKFQKICKDKGLIMSRQLENMLIEFIESKPEGKGK